MRLPCASSCAWMRAASACLSLMGLPAADAAPRRETKKVIPTSTPSRRWFRGVKRWPPLAFGGSSDRVLSNGFLGQRKWVTLTGPDPRIQTGSGPIWEHRSHCLQWGGGWPGLPSGPLRYRPNVADQAYRTERDSMGEVRVPAY